MPVTACGVYFEENGDEARFHIPQAVAKELQRFLLDNRKGNVVLHIKDGKILGVTLEDKTHSTV